MKGLIFLNKKIGYCFIPKTACTSIKEELYRLEYNIEFKNTNHNGKHIHDFTGQHHRGNIDSCEFKFLVIRDPIKRFLSCYSNRVLFHKELSKEYIKKTHPELISHIKKFNPTLNEFIENIGDYIKVDSIRHHVKPMVEFLDRKKLDFFDKVYKIEETSNLEADLSSITCNKVSFGRKQTEGRKIKPSELSWDNLKFLIEFYKEDYKLLAKIYPIENIIKDWEKENKQENPFIIWTLRRSGGTNLGEALFKASKFNAVQHEPFNDDRIFGNITKYWKETQDKEVLHTSIREILKQKPLIKHCFEIIPDEINEALVKISSEFNYNHLFLYREYPTDRLLSLNYARTTGIWGKEHKNTVKLDEKTFEKAVDIKRLIIHEQDSRRKIKLIHDSLNKLHTNSLSVTFESLYQGAYEYSESLVTSTFESLGLKANNITPKTLNKMLRGGSQGTKEDYLRFPGSDKLKELAGEFPRLLLTPSLKIENLEIDNTIETDHFELWNAMPAISSSHSYLSGIALIPEDSEIVIFDEDKNIIETRTELPSPRIKSIYPNNKKSENSRFLSTPVKEGKYYIKIKKGNIFKTKAQFELI